MWIYLLMCIFTLSNLNLFFFCQFRLKARDWVSPIKAYLTLSTWNEEWKGKGDLVWLATVQPSQVSDCFVAFAPNCLTDTLSPMWPSLLQGNHTRMPFGGLLCSDSKSWATVSSKQLNNVLSVIFYTSSHAHFVVRPHWGLSVHGLISIFWCFCTFVLFANRINRFFLYSCVWCALFLKFGLRHWQCVLFGELCCLLETLCQQLAVSLDLEVKWIYFIRNHCEGG